MVSDMATLNPPSLNRLFEWFGQMEELRRGGNDTNYETGSLL